MEIKEEDFEFETFYNDYEFSLKITHVPTGLFEKSEKLSSRRYYFPTKKKLLLALISKLKEL